MSRVYIADIPPDFQDDDIKHLLAEEMEPDDIDDGVFLFFLLSRTQSNGFDEWYESKAVLDRVVLQHFGIKPTDWSEYNGPRFW